MRRGARLLLLGLALTALGGCSLLSFVYGRLDSIATSYAESWFDLDRAQAARFKAGVRARLVEHRREELPRYAGFLGQVVARLEGRPTPAEVDALFVDGAALFEDGLRRTLPLLAETLAGLTPEQVEHLAAELAEVDAEYRAEVLEVDPDDRRRDRRRGAVRQVERWTGRLEPAQRAILERLVDDIPDGAATWAEYREARQRGLLELLRGRADAAAHARYVEEWWLGDRHLEPAHAERLARNRALTVAALAELCATLTPRQRERAVARLRSIAADLEALHRQGGRAG